MMQEEISTLRSQLLVLAGLLMLLALSAGLSRLSLGWWVLVITASVAVSQTLLVMVVFMRLKSGHPVLRIIAILAFAWPLILVALTLGDYFTRSLLHAALH
jgi:caa(3)-type oxidase subunit IV